MEAAELVLDVDEVGLVDPANDIAVLALAPPKKGRKNERRKQFFFVFKVNV